MIPLIVGMTMNTSIAKEYEQYVKSSHLTHLKKTQDVLENFIDDIKWSTYQLAGNSKLLRLISDKDQKLDELERASLVRETMLELNDSLLYNTSFNSIFYIYLKDQDIIITPYSIYLHSDFNESFNFFKMENISSTDWHTAISSQFYNGRILPVRSVIIEDFKNKRMIPYVQTLPIDRSRGTRHIDGVIVYLIGEADFIKFLDTEALPEGGISYIADEKNNLITLVSHSDKEFVPLELSGTEGMIERVIDNRRMFIIYTTSKKNNWKYVSILPEEWVVKNVNYYRLISFSVMFLALIICIAAAYFLSKRWSKPIVTSYKSISGYLNKETREKVTFTSLSTNVNELITYSEDMHDELMSREVFVHNAFVNRLINGFFRNEEDIGSYLSLLGFKISEKYCSAAIIAQRDMFSLDSTQSFNEMIRVKNYLKTRLQQDFGIRIMIAEQENSNLVLIMLTDSGTAEIHEQKVDAALKDFCSSLPDIYSNSLLITQGETVDTLLKLNNSYIQAQDVQSLSLENENDIIIHFKDVDKKLQDFYYPIELESRLINSVKAGNKDILNSVLATLISENMEKRFLDSSKLRDFHFALLNSCHRILNQLPAEAAEDLAELPGRYNNSPDIDKIRTFLFEVCRKQNLKKKSHNTTLIDRVKIYLENNFSDRNLSLQMVSDFFSVNESYMSFFFKEQTGTNFSTFLETLRINKAGELLKTTDESITSIAQKVGYNSDKTFRRVFQKHFHISPCNYREE